MKTIHLVVYVIAVVLCSLLRTLATDAGAIVKNVGTLPNTDQNAIFHFTASWPDGSTADIMVNAGGLNPGAQTGNTAGGNGTPASVSIASIPNGWYFQGESGPTIGDYGRNWYEFDFTFGTPPPPPPPCNTNVCFYIVNNDSQYRSFAIGFNTGNTVNMVKQDLVAPGGNFSYSATVACSNAADYVLYENQSGGDNMIPVMGSSGCAPGGNQNTNSGGQVVVTNLPDVSTNEAPLVPQAPNTNGLPVTPPGGGLPGLNTVSSPIVWPGVDTTLGPWAQNETMKAGHQAIKDAIWSVGSQAHNDASGLANAIRTAGGQAHSDAGAVKSAVDTARQQSHSDLSQILGAVQNITNGIPKNPPMTNYATESTLASLENLYATNSTGLNGNLSNATAAITGLSTSISNITDITNLDIASESTLQAATNLLNGINTNLFAVGTNMFGLATNLAQQTTLAGMSNMFGGSYTNSGVAGDLGVSNAFLSAAFNYDTNISTTNFSVTVSNEASYAQAQADSAAASPDLQGVEGGLAGFLAQMSPVTVDDSWGDPDMTFDFGPFLGQTVGKMMGAKAVNDSRTVMDFNPMHNPDLAGVFNAAKSLFAWIIAIIYLLKCAKDAGKAIEMCEMARGVVVTGPTTKKTYT